jgi:Fur family ferric uptake transcriptional regulator
MTPQRRLILDVLATMRGHIAVDQVYRQVAARYPDVNITTVYRTLEVLEQRGIVRHTHFHEGRSQFERTDEPAHQHLVCKVCGRDQETDLSVLEPLTESLLEKFGFEADFSHTAIVGYCARCKSASAPSQATDSTG